MLQLGNRKYFSKFKFIHLSTHFKVSVTIVSKSELAIKPVYTVKLNHKQLNL